MNTPAYRLRLMRDRRDDNQQRLQILERRLTQEAEAATRSDRSLPETFGRYASDWTIPFFAFPDEVRRIVYTTNAIEALNAQLRRAVRARGHFPSDDSATKLLYLILNRSEKEWKMPPREWSMAKAQFAVLFGERFIKAMAA